MSTKTAIMTELKKLGDASTKKTFIRHGAPKPLYGVKVQHLKTIQKRIKRDHALALELFATGCSDAMYLASLICEPDKFTEQELQTWAELASWHMISEYSVAWAAAESPHGWKLGLAWTQSSDNKLQSTGWATLSSLISVTVDEELNLAVIKKLVKGLPKSLKSASGRVAYTMNGFLISVGSYIEPLSELAFEIAEKIGRVEVDMGDTSCKVPLATEYMAKVKAAGKLGRKRKTAYC